MLIAKHSAPRGFTLLEYMFGIGVGLLALVTALSFWAYSNRSFAAIFQYVDLSNMSKLALDRMSQQLRCAEVVTLCGSNQVEFTDFDGRLCRYRYSPDTREFVQEIPGDTRVLLTDCTALQFTYFQRTPIRGSDALTPAVDTNTCKVVQVNWTCSRPLPGIRQVTDNQVSARVVLRNK